MCVVNIFFLSHNADQITIKQTQKVIKSLICVHPETQGYHKKTAQVGWVHILSPQWSTSITIYIKGFVNQFISDPSSSVLFPLTIEWGQRLALNCYHRVQYIIRKTCLTACMSVIIIPETHHLSQKDQFIPPQGDIFVVVCHNWQILVNIGNGSHATPMTGQVIPNLLSVPCISVNSGGSSLTKLNAHKIYNFQFILSCEAVVDKYYMEG